MFSNAVSSSSSELRIDPKKRFFVKVSVGDFVVLVSNTVLISADVP
jgi:hypothetical protein